MQEIVMSETAPSLFEANPTGRRVRLRTLTVLRWAAVAGQIVAIAVSQRFFGVQIELGLCAVAIGAELLGTEGGVHGGHGHGKGHKAH